MIFYLPIYKQTKEAFDDEIAKRSQTKINKLATPETGGTVSAHMQTQIRSRL